MSAKQKFDAIESEWEDEPMPFREVVRRLQAENYPLTLSVFHKDYGTLTFVQMMPDVYLVYRMGPPLNGTRFGIARTFGNLQMGPHWILSHIDDIFGNVVTDTIALEKSAAAKLLKLQLEAARKLMSGSTQNIPREIQDVVAQMIGEKKPVQGAYNVPNSMAKINTTLFTNGGKRKSRRRQRRKTTRRRR